jgi:hypothetical protein
MERPGRTIGWKIASLLGATALAACAQEPDFGYAQPSLLDRFVVTASSTAIGEPALPMTVPETDLRGMAANLAASRPAPESDRYFGLTNVIAASALVPGASYYDRLRARMPASGEALVNAIAADVDADTAAMERFVEVSQAVVAADAVRARAIAPYAVPDVSAGVRARIAENGRLIDGTGNALAARFAAYRTALDRARRDAPAEERLATLEGAIARMNAQLLLMDRNALAHNVIVSDLKVGPTKG